MANNYVTRINKQPIAASQVAPNSPLESKLIRIETTIADLEGVGAFEIAELTTGANPVPDVEDPSTKVIYLTKSEGSTEADPYTEWIYTQDNAWQVIGTTSVDLTNYVQKVTNGTLGNFAALAADGSIEDSNKSAADFATAAQGAKADTAYQKPNDGIPASDLASAVQNSLGKADSAYQLPANGIPSTDLDSAVQASLGKADTAYQKDSNGIPASDLSLAVQTSLGLADSSYQKPNTGIPSSDLASEVQVSLEKADTAYQKPSGGIPASDINIDSLFTTEIIDDGSDEGSGN